MKTNALISGILLAGGLLASGVASAVPVLEWEWNGTINDTAGPTWAAGNGPGVQKILDAGPTSGGGDADTTFTYDTAGSNFAANVAVRVAEYEDNGADLYNVDFSHATGQAGIVGTTAAYWVDTTDLAGLSLASLGHVRIGGAASEVTKQIYNAKGGNLLLTLDSLNGARSPLLGFAPFTSNQHFYVVDTIVSGSIESLTNELAVVPEPLSLSLFGIGLAALRFGRRRAA